MKQCLVCSSSLEQGARFCSSCGHEQPDSSVSSTESPVATHGQGSTFPGDASSLRARFIPGTMLAGRYRMVERIGQGGMGEVYRAEDLKLGERVALKFLPPGFERDPDRLRRLFSEVSTARRVSHPNVCRMYDVAEAGGIHFLSMEFVDGEDLASLLRRIGHLPAVTATLIARQICLGLAAIHGRGLQHRDLKPANIMIDGRGHARITDFGLAVMKGAVGESDEIVGTPAYMAPEILAGGAATTSSDLYSLGLVLYELFTGRRSFEEDSIEALQRGHIHTPPSAHVRGIDPAIGQVILRCLEVDPARRPPSALAIAAALPGGNQLQAVIDAGQTPSPEMVVDAPTEPRVISPVAGWACLTALLLGLAATMALAPRTRVVPAVGLPEPPVVLAARARDMIRALGLPMTAADQAQGFAYDRSFVEHVAVSDGSRTRWDRLARSRPPVITYWYRQSPRPLTPVAKTHAVTLTDPPQLTPGMITIQLDMHGHLNRLDAVPTPGVTQAGAAPASRRPSQGSVEALFAAAGLDTSTYQRVEPRALPVHYADYRAAWERRPDGEGPARVEAAWLSGQPLFFTTLEPWSTQKISVTQTMEMTLAAVVRPAIVVLAFLVGAYLARRNLRAGRADRKRAFRVASILMGMRLLVWLLGGHHVAEAAAEQFAIALAWSLYDFAYVRIFYIALEPYVRRLWPLVLVTWMRLLDGRHRDPLVGRDLLIGALLGTAISLGVALHQQFPLLLGKAPGVPDNVGFVEPTLAGLMSIPAQATQAMVHTRSAIVLALCFVVILVITRILLRKPWLATASTLVLFTPLALPRGEFSILNAGFAGLMLVAVLVVMMRFGLLAATTGLAVNAALQASAPSWDLGAWWARSGWLAVLLISGLGVYGFVRAFEGRLAIPDSLARSRLEQRTTEEVAMP